jgi:hypothetical protein
MLKWTILSGCAAAVLLAGVVRADQPGVVVGMYQGIGATSCREFAKLYRDNPQGTEDLFFTWGSGYMTAMNLYFVRETGEYRNFGSMSPALQKEFLRNYCADNPLESYAAALMALRASMARTPFPKQNEAVNRARLLDATCLQHAG